jgi:hypothetical protein
MQLQNYGVQVQLAVNILLVQVEPQPVLFHL